MGCTNTLWRKGTKLLHVTALVLVTSVFSSLAQNHEKNHPMKQMKIKESLWAQKKSGELRTVIEYQSEFASGCESGTSGSNNYACSEIDMISHVSLSDLGCGGGIANDMWGWSNEEVDIAIVGCDSGTSFVDVTYPYNPVVLGFTRRQRANSDWRDMKTYKDFVYIGSEASSHGVQVVNVSEIADVAKAYREAGSPPPSSGLFALLGNQFSPLIRYSGVGSSHNIVINEDTGYMYVVGSNQCSGGLHIVDISTPSQPVFEVCHSVGGYVHDAQCLIYNGPDQRYVGQEQCFTFNGDDDFSILDVTDKANIVVISAQSYSGLEYCHQGWLNEDMSYMLMNDEMNEIAGNNGTSGHPVTMMWNLADLLNPFIEYSFVGTPLSIDHNLYVHDGYAWQSNYCSGLRVLNVSTMGDPSSVVEVGYFDFSPFCNAADHSSWWGSWSNYPYFASGIIAVTSIESGLYLLKPNFKESFVAAPTSATVAPTFTPTAVPSEPTYAPSTVPSEAPSALPSAIPTFAPTFLPSEGPSASPSATPTFAPTLLPSTPTHSPSIVPTDAPSASPSVTPTFASTTAPSTSTHSPSTIPSEAPSAVPSATPTIAPTAALSGAPALTFAPTATPTNMPSSASKDPSASPTTSPSLPPSLPSEAPTVSSASASRSVQFNSVGALWSILLIGALLT